MRGGYAQKRNEAMREAMHEESKQRERAMRKESKQREETLREALREEYKPREETMREGCEKMWQRNATMRKEMRHREESMCEETKLDEHHRQAARIVNQAARIALRDDANHDAGYANYQPEQC